MDRKTRDSHSCPFLNNPMTGCRVQELNGQTIPFILEFCGARHPECPLYLHKKAGDGLPEHDYSSTTITKTVIL